MVFHNEKCTAVVAEGSANDWASADRMDEILEAIQPEFLEVEELFRLLKALEESLHKHTKVTVLTL
jgi:hypothetical protein